MISDSLNGKKILLLYARFFGYDMLVKRKLESFGAHVDLFDARANINSFEKAIRKINDRLYIKKQKKFHDSILKRNGGIEYDYVFANDVLDISILEKYRKHFPTAFFVLYLDDSVNNMEGIENTFVYYDRILTFDRKDAEVYKIGFRPLFYADVFSQLRFEDPIIKYDISFVGTCHSDRLKIINKIQSENPNLICYFFCFLQSWFMYYYHVLKEPEYRMREKEFFQVKSIPMDSVAEIMNSSKAIIDIQHPAQTGLTMRTIETLGLGKKLITTNEDIVNYDFYNESNIFVINRDNPVISNQFIANPAAQLPDDIYRKYSLAGWINDVFL